MFEFLQKRKTNPKRMLNKVLGDYSLPTFPDVVIKTLERLRDPNASSSSIAEILSADPGITVKVLRTVNSAAFSPVDKVENLSQAIALLGMGPLESLVLSMGIQKALPEKEVPGFNPRSFWRTAARRAFVAKALSEILHPEKSMDCFTAALLQDMAVPLLVTTKNKEYTSILEKWKTGEKELDELEREVFGWDHAEVATWICWVWQLPETLASAIGGHHKGSVQSDYDCPLAVFLVSFLRETEENNGVDKLIEVANKLYSLPPEQVSQLIEENFKAAEELIEIIL